ncbi:MAG TPA: DUF2905 domain-containing protein [Crenotrichaceae bacterium]|nr:DUF2905 domain-containing protein [Crenotrichaceae bacterium]
MNIGKLLIVIGLGLFAIGLVINFAPWLINWFGKLPGDIRIEKENSFFYFPITSMVIISIILSFIINFFFRH